MIQAIRRRATTLLEMLVVGIMLMGLIGTITTFFSYMPRWFKTVRGRVDVVREEQIARSFLTREASTATECKCVGQDLQFTQGATTVEFYPAQMADRPPGTYELRRSEDGRTTHMKVATQLTEFSCATSNFDGVDVCMVFNEGSGWRRSTFQSRNTRMMVRNLALGDFNRDGINDLATVHTNVTQTGIHTGNATGTFDTGVAVDIDIVTTGKPRDIKALDYDRDGDLDLVVLGETAAEKFTNDGSGGFTSGGTISAALVGSGPYKLATGDFNKDGQIDLAISNETTKRVKILSGSSTGTFSALSLTAALANIPRELETADLDRDGDLDLIVGCVVGGTSTIVVLKNNGSGTFTADGTTYNTGVTCTGLAVGDFNRDAMPDLLSLDLLGDKIWMWPGRSGQTTNFFDDASKANIFAHRPQAIAALDWNVDGFQDLVVIQRPRSEDSTATIHLGQSGTPFFATTTSSTTVTLAVGARDGWAVVTGNVSNTSTEDFVGGWSRPLPEHAGVANHSPTLGPNTAPPRVATFTSGVTLTTGAVTGGLVAGDFNRDGVTDFLVARESSTTHEVFTGSSSYVYTNSSDPNLASISDSLECADFDRDGDLDAVGASPGDRFRFYENNGSAVFSDTDSISGITDITSLGFGDFRRNGILDVVAGCSGANLRHFSNNGAGNFSSTASYTSGTGNGITDLCVGDFNRDGMPDVIVTTSSGTAASTLRYFQCQNSSTRFAGVVNVSPAMTATANKVACADLDRDGNLDLVNFQGNNLQIRRGLGTGATFQTGVNSIALGFTPTCMRIADLNRDGYQDIIVGGPAVSGLGRVAILHKKRNSTLSSTGFEPATFVWCGRDVEMIRVVDYNRDGKPDIAVASSGQSNASILRANW